MLFTAVEQRRIQRSSLTENDTVVALAQNFPAAIENILHVLPDTKTVAVVIGNSPLEKLWMEVLRKEFAPFADRLSFIWYNDRSFADILKHAAALPPHSAIFWHQMNVDAAGVVHEGDKALPTLYAVANAPIFSFTDAFFGGEVVGGPMNSVGRGLATDGRRCPSHPRWREGGRHQNSARRICDAEVRLAADAALGHQREAACRPAAKFISAIRAVWDRYTADSGDHRGVADSGGTDRLAVPRAPAPPSRGNSGARHHVRIDSS